MHFFTEHTDLFPFLIKASNGVMEIMLRGQDGALTYDFEPVPNIVASNGVPLIKLKSPDILYAGSESFTLEVRLTFEPQHELSNNVVCATRKASDQPAHLALVIRTYALQCLCLNSCFVSKICLIIDYLETLSCIFY